MLTRFHRSQKMLEETKALFEKKGVPSSSKREHIPQVEVSSETPSRQGHQSPPKEKTPPLSPAKSLPKEKALTPPQSPKKQTPLQSPRKTSPVKEVEPDPSTSSDKSNESLITKQKKG